MDAIITAGRHGQPGYHSLGELPQRGSVADIALGVGWPELDDIWKIYPGQFTICTGIPNHGKSTFLLNIIAAHARKNGVRTFMYVPEDESHILEKIKMIWGSRDGWDEFISEQCFVQSATPAAYDSVAKTLDWVLDRAVVAVERDNVNLLMIDPWNELERAKPRDMLLGDYIGQCLMYMKQFCRSMNIAVILVAHPTKEGVKDGKTPNLSDIEGSMNWNNKSDNGLIVVRDPVGSTTKVISAKARHIGSGRRGCAFFHVDENSGLFTPLHGSTS